VALGAVAAKTLFVGKSKVTQHHGAFVEPTDKHPYRGYVAYHPAFTLRDPSKLPAFTQDLKRLARAVHGEERAPEAPWSLLRRGNLRKFLREFIEAPEFSFDLETSGYFMHGPGGYINAMSIDLPHRTWVVPCMDYDPINKRHKHTPWRRGNAFLELVKLLVKIQRETAKRCVGHNGKFDNLWLRRLTGFWFKLTFDTMLASHTLDENREHDLKTLARTILDAPEYDLTPKEKKGIVVPRKLYRYGAYDAYYTRKLKEIFYRELQDEPELHRLYHKLIIRVARSMENLEMVGKTVNLEKWDATTIDVQSEVILLEIELNKMVGKTINWNSPPQIGRLLFDELGLEVTQWTDGGAPSTSEEALFDLRDEHPVVNKLLEYRERTKFLGTYLHGLREYMVGQTLYIPYKIHGTVGGRYSSPIHSIPRDGTIRNLVEAPDGWDLFVADISQAELRFAAHLSGDLEMRRCFKNNIDIHWRTLMYTLGQGYIGTEEYVDNVWGTVKALGKRVNSIGDACEVLLLAGHDRCTEIWKGWKEGRYRAKALNFGFCIAEGQRVLTHVGLVPIEQVQDWHLVWDGVEWVSHKGVQFNGYQEVIEYQGLKATPEHEVWTMGGQRLPLWRAASEGHRLEKTGAGLTAFPSRDTSRFSGNDSSRREIAVSDRRYLHSMRETTDASRRQFMGEEDNQLSLSKSQEILRSSIRNSWNALRHHDSALRTRYARFIESLQRARNPSALQIARGVYPLGVEEVPQQRFQRIGFRSTEQRRELLQGQSSPDNLQRQQSKQIKVYDLIDAGPRHRFTVEDCLVHNCYGMFEDKFIELAKTDYEWEPSWDEAHSMRQGFFDLYSGLPKWHDKEKKIVRNNGFARILSGRRRRLPAIYSKEKWIRAEAERQAVNIRVQGFIGDYKSMALVEADDRLNPHEAKLVGEHHDALLGIVRKDCHDVVLPVVRQIMKAPALLRAFNIKLDIPMNSDIELGRWGAGVKYQDPEQRRAA
jgi:DNA polymerase I-like protein with 3'-5' exonuclease and polymerase domains